MRRVFKSKIFYLISGFAILLSLAFMFFKTSIDVYADVETTNYQVGGTYLNRTGKTTEETWNWVSDTRTLTFTANTTLYTESENKYLVVCIGLPKNSTIVLNKGVTVSLESKRGDAIYCEGALTIKGTGSLVCLGSSSGSKLTSGSGYANDDSASGNGMTAYGNLVIGDNTTKTGPYIHLDCKDHEESALCALNGQRGEDEPQITIYGGTLEVGDGAKIYTGDNSHYLGLYNDAVLIYKEKNYNYFSIKPSKPSTSIDYCYLAKEYESEYTISYDANGATSGKLPCGNTVKGKDSLVTVLGNINGLKIENKYFSGWNTKADGTGTSYVAGESFSVTEDTTLYAIFLDTEKTSTITFEKNGGSEGTNEVVAKYGFLLPNVVIPTKAGAVFLGYFDSLVGGTQYYDSYGIGIGSWNKSNSNVSLYAHWIIPLYINGVNVDEEHTSGEGWNFEIATTTLTLNNFIFEAEGKIHPNFVGDDGLFNEVINYGGKEKFTIKLIGDNKIINTKHDDTIGVCCIYTAGELEITGEGSLLVKTVDEGRVSYPIYSNNSLTISAAKVESRASDTSTGSIGLVTLKDLQITNDAKEVITSGNDKALSYGGELKNSFKGFGYTDTLVKNDKTIIDINSAEDLSNLKMIDFINCNPEEIVKQINDLTVELSIECANTIAKLKEEYSLLSTSEKEIVTNYDVLLQKEKDYLVLVEANGEASVGTISYPKFVDAYNALNKGETLKLKRNVDLSDSANHIEITKGFTIDLNGYILLTSKETSKDAASLCISKENIFVTIDNTNPSNGGFDGIFVVDGENSYVLLLDVKLTLDVEKLHNEYADIFKIAKGYEAESITEEFVTVVKKQTIVDLSTLNSDYTFIDGQTLTGVLDYNIKLSIADGATITLKDAEINGYNYDEYAWAGLTCLGDATITLIGNNEVGDFDDQFPAIYVPVNKTLTIDGEGGLRATSYGEAAAIGAGVELPCGNIVINNGHITALAGENAAAIGGAYKASVGTISIYGGYITTELSWDYPYIGIGCGKESTCEGVNIYKDVKQVTVAGLIDYYPIMVKEGEEWNNIDESFKKYEFKDEINGSTITIWKFKSSVEPVDLSKINGTYYAVDGEILTGTMGAMYRVCITPDAKVTLENVTIGEGYSYDECPGITCLGNATIVLKGSNIIKGISNYAGIYVPKGQTLTIEGDGKLEAIGSNYSSGIGSNDHNDTGSIVINGGYIIATGSETASGIGGSKRHSFDNITINGGYVIANGGKESPAIGTYGDSKSGNTSGKITINGGTVIATSGTVSDDNKDMTPVAIGVGNDAVMGDIEINATITKVVAKSENGIAPIGKSGESSTVGEIKIATGLLDNLDAEANERTITGSLLHIGSDYIFNETGEGYSYNKETNTLTLDNFSYVGSGTFDIGVNNNLFNNVISYKGNEILNIVLVGSNNIQNTGSFGYIGGIFANNKVVLSGEGTLTISTLDNAQLAYVISSLNGIVIDASRVEVNAGDALEESIALYTSGDGVIISGGKTYITSGNITSGKSITAGSYGILVNNANIVINENAKLVTLKTKDQKENSKAILLSGDNGLLISAISGSALNIEASTEKHEMLDIEDTGASINNFIYKEIHFFASDVKLVIDEIDAIGEVSYTQESKAKIDDASKAYEALDAEAKAFVTNYSTLEEAASKYEKLKSDNEKALAVVEKIDAIGEVSYTQESKAKIDDASKAYEALDAEAKAFVTNYSTLEEAASKYEKLKSDNEKALAVVEKIDAIGEVSYTQESKAKIDNASKAYDALDDEIKSLVTNYSLLEQAEARYLELKNDTEKADVVIEAINAIGEVTYTLESQAEIDEVIELYNALTDAQKSLVSNKATLDEKALKYEELKNSTVNNAIARIDAIGEVSFTNESKDIIDAARLAYTSVLDQDKELVTNYSLLEQAEARYLELKNDTEKADKVKQAIDAIGEVVFNETFKEKIGSARSLFDALTDSQKALVDNKEKLVNAEKTYANVEAVYEKINAIGDVKFDASSKDKIDEAKKEYEELTEEEKKLVTNFNELSNKENQYKELEHSHNVFVGWMIALIVISGVLVLTGIILILYFFVFKKRTKKPINEE